MKLAQAKKLPKLVVIALLVGAYALPAYAADTSTRPYFKVYGGNVVSGGWFESGGSCDRDSSSNYQDASFSNPSIPADSRNGGILAYANQATGNSADSGGGASSQYAAFALGEIEGGNTGDGYGFYSAGSMAGNNLTAKNLLSFANSSGTYPWGGVFELGTGGSGIRQGNCIPDYYSKMPSTATVTTSALKATMTASDSDSYSVTEPSGGIFNLTNSNVTIGAGAKVTYYVNGDVYIGHNITYALDKDTDVPKFSLVVKGSIYIDPGVNRLDGFYSAQPAVSGASAINSDTGVIWTCHPDSTDAIAYTYPAQNCNNRLVINGAVSAKQVNFLRTMGDLGSASTNEDKMTSGCGSAVIAGNASTDASCANVAEIINYTPEMVIGGSFFATSGGSNNSAGLPIDSILSLPPAF